MIRASENPFSVQKIHALPYWFGEADSVESLAEKFWSQVALGQRRQVLLGAHGTGKSTLLREIGRCWEVQGRTVVRLDGAKLRLTSDQTNRTNGRCETLRRVLLVDSAEKLSWFDWVKIWWRFDNAPVLATVHKQGRFAVLYHCRASFEHFELLCRELVGDDWEWFSEQCPREQRSKIFEARNGDIRQCFFDLYDRVAQGPGPLGQKSRIMCEPSPLIVPEKQA